MDQKTNSERGFLRALDGRKIPYVLERPPQGHCKGVFLLLHGLGVDKNEYLDFYKLLSGRLSREGFEVIRIDFPGHGESTASPRDFKLVNCIADAIVAAKFATDKSNSKTLNIFGTSFGAGPAVVTANFFTSVLESLTLLAPALSYRELYIEPSDPLRLPKYKDFYKRALLSSASIPINDNLKFDWNNALEFALMDLEPELAKVSSRTAIIHGEKDSMVPCELSKAIANRLPEIDLTIVPGMDHGFMDFEDEAGKGPVSQNNLQMIFEKATRYDAGTLKVR